MGYISIQTSPGRPAFIKQKIPGPNNDGGGGGANTCWTQRIPDNFSVIPWMPWKSTLSQSPLIGLTPRDANAVYIHKSLGLHVDPHGSILVFFFTPSSHNHSSFLSFGVVCHWTMIMGERVALVYCQPSGRFFFENARCGSACFFWMCWISRYFFYLMKVDKSGGTCFYYFFIFGRLSLFFFLGGGWSGDLLYFLPCFFYHLEKTYGSEANT